MRPKFAILVVTTAVILLAGIIFLKRQMDPARQPAPPAATASPKPSQGDEIAAASETSLPGLAPAAVVGSPLAIQSQPVTNVPATADVSSLGTAANDQNTLSQETVNLEVMRLLELSRSGDPQSLPALFEAVASPNATIREAALEGIKGKGDTNAIALLKSLAAQKSPDSIQRKELMDAAAFLALPSMSDPAR